MIRAAKGKAVVAFEYINENEMTPILGVITDVNHEGECSYHIKWLDGDYDWYMEKDAQFFLDQAKCRKNLNDKWEDYQ